MITQTGLGITKKLFIIALLVATVGSGLFGAPKVAAQTCDTTTAPPTTWGQVTQNINVTSAGTYRVWSRIKAPNTTANSYYFQVDNGCAINVGDSASIPANAWTWVNYEKGATSNFADITLTAGSHTLKYTGKEADVQLDRVLLLTDLTCIPDSATKGDNCATSDTTPPTTSITAPAAGTSVAVGTTVTINANAADAGGVEKVEFYRGTTLLGTDTTSPYSYAWNTTGTAAGTYSLTTRAYDTSGNTTTSAAVSITLTSNPTDTQAPTAVITSPPADIIITAGDTVTISATATDNVGVTKVEFYRGSALLGVDSTPPTPFTWSWNTTGTATGNYVLTAKAFDAAGNTKVSAGVNVSIGGGDTILPTVNLTAPASGASFAVGTSVTISATASDNIGVTKVEFYEGTNLLNTDTTTAYGYTWNTTGKTAGAYSLTAKAYDAAGNTKTSTAVSISLTSTSLPGDCAGAGGAGTTDGRVNALDLSVLLSKDGQAYAPCDFAANGVIDAADLAILISKWTW